MRFTIREARPGDAEAIRELLPRLSSFRVPPRRDPEELWRGDERILDGWLAGSEPDCRIRVAVDGDESLVGAVMLRLRPELLSGRPSAHLEVVVLAERAEGHGVGKALMEEAERVAREHGALTLTLTVFAVNTRARRLYEAMGYDGELIRYIKDL